MNDTAPSPSTTSPDPIPASRALVTRPSSRRLPARRHVEVSVRSLQLARIARAAGAVAVGLAAQSVLRALVQRRERSLIPAVAGGALVTQRPRAVTTPRSAQPAIAPSVSAGQPFEVARVIEQLSGTTRIMVTEMTVIERRRRR